MNSLNIFLKVGGLFRNDLFVRIVHKSKYIYLSQDKVSNPVLYLRYVDDILAVFNRKSHVNHFTRRLSNNSVLNFTTEYMNDNKFNFLDVAFNINNTKIILKTSVYIKNTDKGSYINFSSHTLLS